MLGRKIELETKIIINYSTIIFTAFSIIVSVFGFFIIRMVKGYDKQISELFDRTKDLPGIREAIDWIKCEVREIKK